MRRLLAAMAVGLLTVGTAGAARAPVVESRTEAVVALQGAIADELVAIALLRRSPPRRQSARSRISRSADRLSGVYDFLSRTPGAATAGAEEQIGDARSDDSAAAGLLQRGNPRGLPDSVPAALRRLERALQGKRAALPILRALKPVSSVPSAECSDGRDNDGDGIVDWRLEPGCTSARDVRERSRFDCAVETTSAGRRLDVSGSCTGPFAEIEFLLLDGVRLQGRYDVQHALACEPATTTGVRCTTKDGAQNPAHLVGARLRTTSKEPGRRLELRFFDVRKRELGRIVLPPVR